MVKFSKQFEGQLVPEWKDAFVDYWQLKKDVKKMQVPRDNTENMNKQSSPTFSHRFFTPLKKVPFFGSYRHKEQEVIQVHRKLASSVSKGDVYETELLDQFTDTDAAKEFFARLDLQLNKVNQFYKRKEQEFMDRGDCLKKQMGILLELKLELKKQQKQELTENGTKTEPLLSCTIICQDESNKGIQIDNDNSQEITSCERNDENLEYSEKMNRSGKSMEKEGGKLRSLSNKRFNHQGKNLMINIPLTTPSRTFSALSDSIWGDIMNPSKRYNQEGGSSKVNVNKSKLHRAEKMIRGAYVELFKGLGYLQTYRNLNLLAFVKILKKFDKVTGKQVLSVYLKVVESSYFNSSDKAIKLMDEVEELFVKHFAEDDKRKAMKYLNPKKREESHAVTFFIGLFLGCFVALLVGYCIMAHITGMYTQHSDNIYMETVYPVLSMFSLLFLHLFLYGCNIFLWRKTRINYNFIFEFSPTKALKYRDVFLICTTSMAIVVGVLFAHLSLTAKGYTSTHVQAIPGLLLLLFVMVLLCPLNIVYKSSRYHFLEILRNIFLSPLYKVVMVDFFMADQLCSQVPTLRSLEYVACYYITGSFKTQNYGFCSNTPYYRNFAYAISFLPYYWRAMQCARRWFDEGDTNHLINLGKYVSAMLAAGTKVAYEKEKSIGWLSLVVAMSSAATVYQLYWDFVKDWGLLQANSKNPWLRNELILRRKFIYFLSMGLNFVLRLAWLQTVLHYNFGSLDYRVTSFFLAALEVIRRGHWNFYRLENEHLNNAGKFRAVKTVPLPFHEVDQD